jgi:hypothetical protein
MNGYITLVGEAAVRVMEEAVVEDANVDVEEEAEQGEDTTCGKFYKKLFADAASHCS